MLVSPSYVDQTTARQSADADVTGPSANEESVTAPEMSARYVVSGVIQVFYELGVAIEESLLIWMTMGVGFVAGYIHFVF